MFVQLFVLRYNVSYYETQYFKTFGHVKGFFNNLKKIDAKELEESEKSRNG